VNEGAPVGYDVFPDFLRSSFLFLKLSLSKKDNTQLGRYRQGKTGLRNLHCKNKFLKLALIFRLDLFDLKTQNRRNSRTISSCAITKQQRL